MSIGNIIKNKQPDVYKQLIIMAKNFKYEHEYSNYDENDHNFKNFERMMRHDSYKKVRGCIRQVKHG